MRDILIKHILGQGVFGITYLAEDIKTGDVYALKRQKILKSDIEKTSLSKSSLLRELYFFKWINSLGKEDQKFFMKLIDHKFYKCDFKIERKVKNPDEKLQKLFDKLDASPYCLDLLVDLKDGIATPLVFASFTNKPILNRGQIYSMVTQCLFGIYLMHKAKFIHSDNHLGNIAFKKVPRNEEIIVHIGNKKYQFPSYGYRFSYIDYGLVKYKKFVTTKKDLKEYEILYKYNGDLDILIYTMLFGLQKIMADLEKANKEIVSKPPVGEIFKNNLLWKIAKEKILSYFTDDYFHEWYRQFETGTMTSKINKDMRKNVIESEIMRWVAIYDKKLFCQLKNHKYIPNLIDDDDIKFIVCNQFDMGKIVEYFCKKLK